MVDELPDSQALLQRTDWSQLEHGSGPAAPGTPAKLAGLTSGDDDKAAVTIALNHLWDDLLHQGSLYSATPTAALYVAAVLSENRNKEPFITPPRQVDLLEWLAEVAYAVGAAKQRQLEEWFGPGVMDRNPLSRQVRATRPTLFRGIFPYTSDADQDVEEAALLAVVHLLDAPELAHHIEGITPKVRSVLAVSSKQGYRNAAISALAAWGEDVESLKDSTDSTEEADSGDDFWNADRGDVDNPPF